MTASLIRSRQPRPLDAGSFQPEVSSFRLHLAAEGKAAKTITTYTQAVQWLAPGFLLPESGRAPREWRTRRG
jgi:integrase/recombinase XerD